MNNGVVAPFYPSNHHFQKSCLILTKYPLQLYLIKKLYTASNISDFLKRLMNFPIG